MGDRNFIRHYRAMEPRGYTGTLRGGYDAKLWLDLLQDEAVTVWYTAPTALRMLMREDNELYRQDLGALKHIFSVGEPLNPEVSLLGTFYAWKRDIRRVVPD